MKTLLLLLFAVTISGAQLLAQEQTLLDKRIPAWVKPAIEKSEVAQNYIIIDSINPFYLEADFTGDKQDDIVFFVRHKDSGKQGLMIVNRGKNLVFVLAGGKDNIGMGDNISWCDNWFVYREKSLFDGSGHKKVALKYPAIRLNKTEKVSLFVYWSGKKYKTFIQVV